MLTPDQKEMIQSVLDTHDDEQLCDLFFPGIFDAVTGKAEALITRSKRPEDQEPYQFVQHFPDIQ